jgi:hypothetical protein
MSLTNYEGWYGFEGSIMGFILATDGYVWGDTQASYNPGVSRDLRILMEINAAWDLSSDIQRLPVWAILDPVTHELMVGPTRNIEAMTVRMFEMISRRVAARGHYDSDILLAIIEEIYDSIRPQIRQFQYDWGIIAPGPADVERIDQFNIMMEPVIRAFYVAYGFVNWMEGPGPRPWPRPPAGS